MLADVLLVDGTNVNHRLVQDGWCGGIGSTRRGIGAGRVGESSARDKKGLWANQNSMPPWEWRKRSR